MSVATMRRTAAGPTTTPRPGSAPRPRSRSSWSCSSSSTSSSPATTSVAGHPPAPPGRDPRAPGARGLGLLEGREMTHRHRAPDEQGLRLPDPWRHGGAGSRRSSPACTRPPTPRRPRCRSATTPTGPGSLGPVRHGLHRPRRHDRPGDRSRQVRGLEPGRRRASQHEAPDDRRRGRVGREHERVGARVDRVLGRRDRALHRRPVRERRPARRRGAQGARVCRSTAAPWSSTPTSTA